MKILKTEVKGLQFIHREGTSDLKTINEVVGRRVYQQRKNKIEKGSYWYDCGGNIGAFAVLACSLGAEIEVFEPDPFNMEILEQNLKLNGFKAKLHQKALVHDDRKNAFLYAGNNGNFWRNSLIKNWNGKGIQVECAKFDEVVQQGTNIKMDIEGAEMPIIESTNLKFKRLIFEWSFDIDPDLTRYWNILERLKLSYSVNCPDYKNKGVSVWPKSWFPACVNVFCYEKNI